MKTCWRRLAGATLAMWAATTAWAQAAGEPAADPWEAALAALAEPITVQTRRGADFVGRPVAVGAEGLVLRARVDAGEVDTTFAPEEVLGLRFPGNALKQLALERYEGGSPAEALAAIDRLFAQRSPFFGFGAEAEAGYFADTVELYRRADRLLDGLARAEVVRAHVRDPERLRLLDRERMLAFFLLGLEADAANLADAWIAREGRAPDDALGSCVRALLQLRRGEGDAAFFTVLQPIVFSGARTIPHLDLCYALAIELARRLDRPEVAARLEDERARRGIAPPADWAPFSPPDFSPLTTLRPTS